MTGLSDYLDIEEWSLRICPTCKEAFGSVRGMSIHHVNKHPEEWEDRFWNLVDDRDDGCWEWRGSMHGSGYGEFNSGDYSGLAHRVSYTIHNGEPEENVLHHCDNRQCVNPDHLYDGTQEDNVRDMFDRGRANPRCGPGEQSNASVLSREDVVEVKEMLSDGIPRRSIADEFGMSVEAIGHIARGESWGHL